MEFHSTVRIFGQNEITFEVLNSPIVAGNPSYNYIIGVGVPAVVMILVFIIWLFTVCCLKTCRRCCCRDAVEDQKMGNQRLTLVVFNLCCITAIVAWGVGLEGNIDTSRGFNQMIAGYDTVVDKVNSALAEANTTRGVVVDIKDDAVPVMNLCTNFTSLSDPSIFQAPFDAALNGIDSFVNPVRTEVNNIQSQADDMYETS